MNAFAVLAEPNRRLILDSLLNGAQPVNALVDQCSMSQPVVSKHLRVLRDAGLVVVKPDGQRRLYSINPAPLAELETWLEPYRRFWSNNLDALEQHLDELEKKGKPYD